MKPVFLVTAPVATRSGYGAHSRDIVRALVDIGKWDVKTQPVRWGSTPQNALRTDNDLDQKVINTIMQNPQEEITSQPDIHLHLVVPNEFNPLAKYNIGMTAGLEATLIPQSWIEGMNRMDLNLLSSKHGLDSSVGTVMKNNDTGQELKVTKPTEVLFEGCDTSIYKITNALNQELSDSMDIIEDNWNFLFVGHWLQGNLGEDRKDVGTLIQTFIEAFKGKKGTGLIMKVSGGTPSTIDEFDMMKKIRHIKAQFKNSGLDEEDLPNIYIVHGDLSDMEMNQLYNHSKVKAHISFTHGEGFGRPLLEASMSEKPIIAPDWSGHVDFLSKQNSILISGKLDAMPPNGFQEGIWQEGMGWFHVDTGAGIGAMREVRKNYRKWKLSAKKLAMVNRVKFSMDAMTKKLDEILMRNLPEFTETVQATLPNIRLPKLEKVI
jgi:glycosyltransferase involved in cell wall biosynthesis